MTTALIRPIPLRASHVLRSGLRAAPLFVFDAVVNEAHELTGELTENPLDDGSVIADHFRVLPEVFVLTGWVSATPLKGSAELGGMGSADFQAWEAARKMLLAAEPVRVVTPVRVYDSMVCTSVKAPRVPEDGQGLQITLMFKQVVFAHRQEILIAALPEVTSGKSKVGKQPTTEPTDAEKAKVRMSELRKLTKRSGP